MKITKMGSDFVRLTEVNMADRAFLTIPRIHIIELKFLNPTIEKVEFVLKSYSSTNRFVISDNVKFYNSILKNTNKKYYVANTEGDALISFFKKNNKVLLDTTKLSPLERAFVFSVCLKDVLDNTEVMIVTEKNYRESLEIFNGWTGNLIVV